MERQEYVVDFGSFTIKSFERFAMCVAPSRAQKNKTTVDEEFNKIITQVLTGMDDNYIIEENKATIGATQ